MSLTRLIMVAALILAGCGDDAGEDNNGASNDANNGVSNTENNGSSNTENNDGTGGTPDRPELVEPDGCFAEPGRPALEGDEITYSQATEVDLLTPRMTYGSRCGSAMEAEIDWISVFSSRGFDDDEYEQPGAVASALVPFFDAGAEYCFDSTTGEIYRDTVERVVFLPTDTDDRIGLCFEEENSTLVYRFKLVEGEATSEALTEQEITDWFTMNLE